MKKKELNGSNETAQMREQKNIEGFRKSSITF